MNVMGPDKDMAAIEYALRQRVTGEGPAGPQMYEALMSILGLRPDAESEGDAAPSRIAPAVPRPLILIPLDEHINILGGDGDDTILGLTDGTTITGADYLNRPGFLRVACYAA